jgi:hypothetical protein
MHHVRYVWLLLQNIASISAGNDDSVGEMIADALDKVRGAGCAA